MRPSLVLEWGEVGLAKGLALEAREAITVLRLGGKEEETGREDGGRGAEGRFACGIGELRVPVGRKIGDKGGDGLSTGLSIVLL